MMIRSATIKSGTYRPRRVLRAVSRYSHVGSAPSPSIRTAFPLQEDRKLNFKYMRGVVSKQSFPNRIPPLLHFISCTEIEGSHQRRDIHTDSRPRHQYHLGQFHLCAFGEGSGRVSSCRSRSSAHPTSLRQVRLMSSSTSWLPEVVQNFSVWGGSGYLLKTIHMDGAVPYWACFAIISIGLRTALLPVVVHGAHMAARFGKVAPDLQFIVTLFQKDLKRLKAENRSLYEQRLLFTQNLQTLRTIYKLHNINPFAIFLSPLLQIPVFWYIATDLRKIVNGADPALAQELTESVFLWVPDLTEPDPWYGLPIAAGAMLYLNIEVAVGRRNLSGSTAAKSDFAGWIKDAFQTLAVFMPCFVAQSPSGLQIYLVSSFTFTLVQGAAIRNDYARTFLGLPLMGSAPQEPKFANEFIEFKKLEQKARELRGDGPVLGKNVLAMGFETSFAGTYRPSTIKGSGIDPDQQVEGSKPQPEMDAAPKVDMSKTALANRGPIVDGVSAPRWQLEEQLAAQMAEEEARKIEEAEANAAREFKSRPSDDELMEAANRGVVLAPRAKVAKTPERLSVETLKRRKNKVVKTVRRKKR